MMDCDQLTNYDICIHPMGKVEKVGVQVETSLDSEIVF